MADRIRRGCQRELKELTLYTLLAGLEFADSRGIIIADTKFEFALKMER